MNFELREQSHEHISNALDRFCSRWYHRSAVRVALAGEFEIWRSPGWTTSDLLLDLTEMSASSVQLFQSLNETGIVY
jgi:hypothetical protein